MRALATSAAVAVPLLLGACGPSAPDEHEYPAWGFAAAFTATPKLTVTPASADGLRAHALLAAEEGGADDFVVSAADAGHTDRTLDQITDDAARSIAHSLGGEVGPKTDVAAAQSTDRAIGREVRIDREGKPYLAVRIFVVKGWYYEVAARTNLGPDDPAAQAFLNSFRIIGPPRTSAR